MDNEILEWINCSMEEIKKKIEELRWQKYLTLLPNRFLEGEGDSRALLLLYLSWLLTDLPDCNRLGYTPREIAEILRDVSGVIASSTEPC